MVRHGFWPSVFSKTLLGRLLRQSADEQPAFSKRDDWSRRISARRILCRGTYFRRSEIFAWRVWAPVISAAFCEDGVESKAADRHGNGSHCWTSGIAKQFLMSGRRAMPPEARDKALNCSGSAVLLPFLSVPMSLQNLKLRSAQDAFGLRRCSVRPAEMERLVAVHVAARTCRQNKKPARFTAVFATRCCSGPLDSCTLPHRWRPDVSGCQFWWARGKARSNVMLSFSLAGARKPSIMESRALIKRMALSLRVLQALCAAWRAAADATDIADC